MINIIITPSKNLCGTYIRRACVILMLIYSKHAHVPIIK